MNARGKEVESVGQTTPDPAQDRRDAEKDCPFPFWSTKKKNKGWYPKCSTHPFQKGTAAIKQIQKAKSRNLKT